jgi:hypothetical protein
MSKNKSKGKSKAKRFRSKVVKGKQRVLPLKGLKSSAAAQGVGVEGRTVKRAWNKEWGSPMIAGRVPDGLAKAWRAHVVKNGGKRHAADVFRKALAHACGFKLAAAEAK